MLELIAAYTGFEQLSFIAGMYRGNSQYSVGVVHHGTTKDVVPKNFSSWNLAGFKTHIVDHFTGFMRAIRGKLKSAYISNILLIISAKSELTEQHLSSTSTHDAVPATLPT